MNKKTQNRVGFASILAGIIAIVASMLTRNHQPPRPTPAPTATVATVEPTPVAEAPTPEPAPPEPTPEANPEPQEPPTPPTTSQPEPEPQATPVDPPAAHAPMSRLYPGDDEVLVDVHSGNELLDGTPLVMQWHGEWYDVTVKDGHVTLPPGALVGDWCLVPVGSQDECPNMHSTPIHQAVRVKEP